jgi:hypothetical protein
MRTASLLVGGSLFHVVLRNRAGRIEIAQPFQISSGQLQYAGGRNQCRFGLQ